MVKCVSRYKLKTHRGAAKRFKVTGSGRLVCRQSHTRHNFTHKSSKRKRHLRARAVIKACHVPAVRRMLSLSALHRLKPS